MRTRLRLLASTLVVAALLVAALLPPPVRGQAARQIIIWFLGFNTTLPPFDKLPARQAVATALDRVQLAAADANFVAVGVEPPGCLGHNPAVRMHPYNPQRAQELWAQSGVNLEEIGDLNLWYLSALRRFDSRKELEILTANLSAIGIKPVLREFGNYTALDRIATLPVVRMSYWGVGWDTFSCQRGTFLEELVHSRGDFNRFGFWDATVDSLIEQAIRVGDRQSKIRFYQEAEQKILDDAIIIPVWWWSPR